jgi:riboflavin synthase alpha subunit
MFSGIIQGIGEVARAEARSGGVTLTLRVPEPFRGCPLGTSVAVSGTCLTVVRAEGETLTFDAVGATLKRTLLGRLRPGDRVNLEPSLRLGAAVDGHLVTGHVDGLGTVEARRPGDGAVFFDIRVPEELGTQIAPRGSVAVDGVSLTVAEVRGLVFSVSIVPYTLEETILGDARPGRQVHIETDVLAKYVQRALAAEEGTRGLAEWLTRSEKLT